MYTFHKPVDGGYRFKWSCSRSKSNKGVCNAFLKVYQKGKAECIMKEGEHVPGCLHPDAHKAITVDESVGCSDDIQQFVEEQYTSDAHHSGLPEKLWCDTCNHFGETVGKNFS
jgi:hypothetical protein